MSTRGHNENAVRLAALADDAKTGLERVDRGEMETLEGWLAYGAALNEGRSLFAGDLEFGQWIKANALSQLGTREIKRDDRVAAMWAAANADQYEEARAAGNARTIRGIHDKWKQIEADRQAEALKAEKEEAVQAAKIDVEEKRKEAERLREELSKSQKTVRESEDRDEVHKAVVRIEETEDAINAAEKAAEEAEAIVSQSADIGAVKEPEEDDPSADLRAEFRKLSDEGQEDDWVGLREENADLRKQVAAQRSEIEHQKTVIDELSADNQGAIISKLQRQLGAAKYERDEAKAATKRMEYRLKLATKGEAA